MLDGRVSKVWMVIAAAACLAACVPEEEEAIVVIVAPGSEQPRTIADPTGNDDVVVPTAVDGEGCVDADGDGWAVGCVDFAGSAPDCDDADANNWLSCATCVDADGDGASELCDAYVGIEGPDCADDDPNSWSSCATCVDGDGDGSFTGCDSYVTVQEDCLDTDASIHVGVAEVIGNGIDDDCSPDTPDDCTYVPTPAVDPEPGILAGLTRMHNLWRWRVGVQPLKWNASLAADAEQYAKECAWEHAENRFNPQFDYVGENLYATTAQQSASVVLDSVQSWADERYDFDFGFTTGQTTGGQVGHYTQMVWDESTEVGCGVTWCGNGIAGIPWSGGTMVVCRYGPGGNYTNQKPYDFKSGACLDLDNDDVWQGADPDDTDRNKQ